MFAIHLSNTITCHESQALPRRIGRDALCRGTFQTETGPYHSPTFRLTRNLQPMKKHSRRLLFILTSFLVSGVFLTYFIYSISGHWDEVAAAFARAKYLYLIPSVALIGLLYVCRVLRWRLFLHHLQDVSYLSLASATCIGFMSNCVLPVRVGELIRPFILYRREKMKLGHAIGSALGLERVFDVVGLAVLLVVTWIILGAAQFSGDTIMSPSVDAADPPAKAQVTTSGGDASGNESVTTEQVIRERVWAVWGWGLLLAGLAGAGLIMFALLAVFPQTVLRVVEMSTQWLPVAWHDRLMDFVQSVVEAMKFMRHPASIVLALLFSVLIWLLAGTATYTLSASFDLGLGLGGGFFVAVCVAVAVALPQAPSFVGVFHVAAMTGAELFLVPRSAAAAFAILLWAINVIPITVVGLGFLWVEGFSLSGLAKASQEWAADDI